MAVERVDRRVGRTRRLLKEALFELIRERGYEKVSIRDIAERADVGRSTFYTHFASKEDLLFDGFDEWLLSRADAEAEAGAGADRVRFRFSLPFLHHIGQSRHFFRAFLGSAAGARIRRKTLEILAQIVRRELDRMEPEHDEDSRAREPRVQLIVGAFMGLTAWWVDDACRLPVEEVDRVFQSMAVRVVAEPGGGGGRRTQSSSMPR